MAYKTLSKTLVLFANLTVLAALAAPSGPDLCVDSVQPPAGLTVGQSGQVLVRLSNKGSAPVPSGRLLLSVDGQAAGELKMNQPLAAQAKAEYAIPWVPKASGRHQIRVEAKAEGADSDPSNNAVEQTVEIADQVLPGEARLMSLSVNDQDLPVGLPVDVSLGLENNGDRAIHRFQVSLFEDQQRVLSKVIYTNLEAHGSKDYQVNWIPKKVGHYHLTAVLGDEAKVPNPKLRNGRVAYEAVTVIGRAGYFLNITKLDLPTQGKVGQEVVATVVIRNSGDLDASQVKVILQTDEGRVSSQTEAVRAGQEGHFEVRWVPHASGQTKVRLQVEGSGRPQDITHKVEKQAVVQVSP